MNSISRHTFLTRSYILSLLNSSAPPPPPPQQQQPSTRVDRHDLLDHPSLQTAAKCCVFIKAVGRSMGFPTRTINTAQLLVHRTYIYRPQPQATATDIATACLFVAAKMEETLKKLKDILAHAFMISSQTVEDARAVPS
ncbi:RNA polymerase II C-terminal domain kinase beta subunit, partial [Linderina macrospora]